MCAPAEAPYLLVQLAAILEYLRKSRNIFLRPLVKNRSHTGLLVLLAVE